MFYIKEMYYIDGNINHGDIITKLTEKRNKLIISFQNGHKITIKHGKVVQSGDSIFIWNGFKYILELRMFDGFMTDEEVDQMMGSRRIEGSFFTQNQPLTDVNEGWKMHISANSMADYMQKLRILIPELQKSGITFKVVRPSRFYDFSEGQVGKYFTVYLTKIPCLNQNALNCIFSGTSYPVKGELQVGTAYFRYGAYRGKLLWNPNRGEYVNDVRGTYKPDFIGDNDWYNLFTSVSKNN